jgi:hypothetical protein
MQSMRMHEYVSSTQCMMISDGCVTSHVLLWFVALGDMWAPVNEQNFVWCREGGISVFLPAHIYIDRCTTLKDAMAKCESPRDALHELFTICQNLTKQLQTQHRRSICLRDINSSNVVCANVGTSKSWTLLEYCSTQRSGTKVDHLPARCCPPEVCASAS